MTVTRHHHFSGGTDLKQFQIHDSVIQLEAIPVPDDRAEEDVASKSTRDRVGHNVATFYRNSSRFQRKGRSESCLVNQYQRISWEEEEEDGEEEGAAWIVVNWIKMIHSMKSQFLPDPKSIIIHSD